MRFDKIYNLFQGNSLHLSTERIKINGYEENHLHRL